MTVSRVINHEENVRATTRDSVLRSIQELGYQPNQAARSLAGADQIHIGLLYDNARTAYVSAFLVGGLLQTSQRNVQLVVRQCETPDQAVAAIEQFAGNSIDGVILPPPLSDWEPVLEAIDCADLPTMLVATGRPHTTCSAVGIDDLHAARTMVDYLLQLGHRRIGFITGDPDQEASQRRLDGYRDALQRAGIDANPKLIAEGQFTYRSGLEAAERLLSLETPPSAIFASNDDMAAATVAVAHRRGIEVPGDLSVCGFDDTAIAQTLYPELTTIHQPIEDMSRTAVDYLISKVRSRRSGKRAARRHVVLEHTLICRQSCAAPKAS